MLRIILFITLAVICLNGCKTTEVNRIMQPDLSTVPILNELMVFNVNEHLKKTISTELESPMVRHLKFSETGDFLLALTSTSLLPSKNGIPRLVRQIWVISTNPVKIDHFFPLHDIMGEKRDYFIAGLLTDNTFYFSGKNEFTDEHELHIYQIDPFQEIARYQGIRATEFTNDDLIVGSPTINWRTGETHEGIRCITKMSGIGAFTSTGWILCTEFYKSIAMQHPVSEEFKVWRPRMTPMRVITSASEKYMIAQGTYHQCRVWQMPGKKEVGRCLRNPWKREPHYGISIASHPQKDRFAVSWGDIIHAYDIEPFRQIIELELERNIYSMGFAGDDILVVMTDRNIQVWDITRQELIAVTPESSMLTVSSPNVGELYSSADLVSPDGRWIVVYRANQFEREFVLYEIPHRK